MNHRSNYNEIIVEGAGPHSQWSAHAASTIGAFFQIKGSALDAVRYHHANFFAHTTWMSLPIHSPHWIRTIGMRLAHAPASA